MKKMAGGTEAAKDLLNQSKKQMSNDTNTPALSQTKDPEKARLLYEAGTPNADHPPTDTDNEDNSHRFRQ